MSETPAGIEAVEAEPAALHPVHDLLVDCLADSLGFQRLLFCVGIHRYADSQRRH